MDHKKLIATVQKSSEISPQDGARSEQVKQSWGLPSIEELSLHQTKGGVSPQPEVDNGAFGS